MTLKNRPAVAAGLAIPRLGLKQGMTMDYKPDGDGLLRESAKGMPA